MSVERKYAKYDDIYMDKSCFSSQLVVDHFSINDDAYSRSRSFKA